ncbi:MAG: FecR domain-containing protein [Pirellulales bacterium]|nr:FecR domain-containing protein [Pirellulales bacterium]
MSLSPQQMDELHALLSDVWDRGATPERLQAIEEYARLYGREAYEAIVEFTSLHAALASQVASARALSVALANMFADPSPLDSSARIVSLARPAGLLVFSRRAARTAGWRAIVAGVAAIVGWIAWSNLFHAPAPPGVHQATMLVLERPGQPVACIVKETNAVWLHRPDTTTLKQGQRIDLQSGVAQLSLASGADIVMHAPCNVTLLSDNRVRLAAGEVTARVAEWATGFVVETNSLRVTDLGTQFTVSADSSGVTEAHVLEGSVLAEPFRSVRPDGKSQLLSKGQAIRVSLSKSTIDLIAAKEKQFIDHIQSFRPLKPIALWNTGLGQEVGSDDSHWQVVDGDPALGPYPRPAVVTGGDPVYLDNMPDASQWISISRDQLARPDSTIRFETRFDLTGYDLSSVRIVGLFLVDDAINSLTLNGRTVPFERWQSTWDVQDFQKFRAIEFSEGFLPEENVISIEIYNSPSRPESPGSPNPMGMRVEWQAFGCENR